LDANKEWPTTIRALIDSIFAPYLNTDGQCLFVDGPDLQIQQQSDSLESRHGTAGP